MRFRFALQSVGFHLTRVGVGMGLCRAGRQVLGAPLAELPGANVKLRRYLRQPLAAVQQPLHCLRLELPREAPSGSPLRHPSLLGCLGSLANPPAPGGSPVLKLTLPGMPDLYHGTELWDLNLVDPDNRRPVDYALREEALAEVTEALVRDRRGTMRGL